MLNNLDRLDRVMWSFVDQLVDQFGDPWPRVPSKMESREDVRFSDDYDKEREVSLREYASLFQDPYIAIRRMMGIRDFPSESVSRLFLSIVQPYWTDWWASFDPEDNSDLISFLNDTFVVAHPSASWWVCFQLAGIVRERSPEFVDRRLSMVITEGAERWLRGDDSAFRDLQQISRDFYEDNRGSLARWIGGGYTEDVIETAEFRLISGSSLSHRSGDGYRDPPNRPEDETASTESFAPRYAPSSEEIVRYLVAEVSGNPLTPAEIAKAVREMFGHRVPSLLVSASGDPSSTRKAFPMLGAAAMGAALGATAYRFVKKR